MTEQLDIFQPERPQPEAVEAAGPDAAASEIRPHPRVHHGELPGETWEDIFWPLEAA